MKLTDIVDQLRVLLPRYTDLLSSKLELASVVSDSNVVTITTTPFHGLRVSEAVSIEGFESKTSIVGVSRDGLVFTFTTGEDHDLTFGWQDHETVTLDGFVDSNWNGSFVLSGVPNRRTFQIQSANNIPLLSSNEVLYENRVDGINGLYSVLSVLDNNTFTVVGENIKNGTYLNGSVHTVIKLAGSINMDRALELYTEQNHNDIWAYVIMDSVEVSKDRDSISDAISTPTTGSEIRMRLLDGFTINFIKDVSDESAAQDAIDLMRHTLLSPVLRSVFGARFCTGLSNETDFRTVLVSHGPVFYDKSKLVYSYKFELSMDITEEDAVVPGDTRAYRDTNYTHTIEGEDTDDLTVRINHDESPL